FACFLPTTDHFSSTWTSRVEGGKGRPLVVGGLGVATGEQGQSCDGILTDPHQPGGLADAAAVGEVLGDRRDLVVRQLGVEQRGALELGEAGLAGVAVQQPVIGLAEAAADREVAGAPLAVPRAVAILAAEAVEVVRGHGPSR